MAFNNQSQDYNEDHIPYERRIIITVVASIGVLIACVLLLVVIPCSKAYKSVLQRIMLLMVFCMLVEDSCRVVAIYYQPSNATTAMRSGCTALGAFTVLFHWETYLVCLLWALYLLAIVCVQTRSDFASFISKLQASTTLRIGLELGIYISVLIAPILVLWIPFYDPELQYGYNRKICSMELITNDSVINMEDIFIYGPILLTGSFVICFFIGVSSVYCIMPTRLKKAKEAMRNLLIFSISLVAFFVVVLLISQIINFCDLHGYSRLQVDALYLIITTIGKFGIIIGYFIVFHCTKKKKSSTKYKQIIKAEYGSFNKSVRKTILSYTHFSIPHTGQFNTSFS